MEGRTLADFHYFMVYTGIFFKKAVLISCISETLPTFVFLRFLSFLDNLGVFGLFFSLPKKFCSAAN